MITVTSESNNVQITTTEINSTFEKIIESHNSEFPFSKLETNSKIQMTLSKFLIVFSNIEENKDIVIDKHLYNLIDSFKKSKNFINNQNDFSKPTKQEITKLKDDLKQSGFQRNLYDYQLNNLFKLSNIPNGANFSVP